MRIGKTVSAEATRIGLQKGLSAAGKSIEQLVSGNNGEYPLDHFHNIAAHQGQSNDPVGRPDTGPFVRIFKHAVGSLCLSQSNQRAAQSIEGDFDHTGEYAGTGSTLKYPWSGSTRDLIPEGVLSLLRS